LAPNCGEPSAAKLAIPPEAASQVYPPSTPSLAVNTCPFVGPLLTLSLASTIESFAIVAVVST